jgi:glycosyltransferase involved in cell wall biosynthesis
MIRKVLHLRSSGGVLGAESVLIELGKHTPEFGYQSIIGAIKNRNDPFPEFIKIAKENGIETVVFECKNSLDVSLMGVIKSYIVKNNIDILHCHGYKEDFYGFLTPVKIPKMATNHLWKRTTLRLKIYSIVDAFILHFFRQVVGVSDEIVMEMQRHQIKNAIKIPNGVDLDKFAVRNKVLDLYDRFNVCSENVIVGMISSLTPEKGHEYAIKAMCKLVKEIPEIRLLIVGDGILRSDIQRQIESNSLERFVKLVGIQRNIPELLSIIDIFILPSLKEGLPIALLEAMASGKAVIATRVGENTNVIENEKTGLLIDPGNFLQISEAILTLTKNKGSIGMFGANARVAVEAQYSSQIMCKRYCEIYKDILSC